MALNARGEVRGGGPVGHLGRPRKFALSRKSVENVSCVFFERFEVSSSCHVDLRTDSSDSLIAASFFGMLGFSECNSLAGDGRLLRLPVRAVHRVWLWLGLVTVPGQGGFATNGSSG